MPQPEQLISRAEQEFKDTPKPEEAAQTAESVVESGNQMALLIEQTSTQAIESGNTQIISAVASAEGTAADIEKGTEVVIEVNEEIADLSAEAKGKIDAILIELASAENDAEKREKLAKKCREVIEKIVGWAEEYGIDISSVKKMGGGFVNLVLLIETADGRGYVAKAFTEEGEATVTRQAQEDLNSIAKKDETFIPKVIEWIDDKTLISEKAEGRPIRKILAEAKNNPERIAEAAEAFYDLGRTLASLHERTEKPFEAVKLEQPDEDFRMDAKKLKKHLALHIESGLLDINEGELESLTEKVDVITEGGNVSLIHGDAHLDQFFKAPDKSMISIVDYDSLHQGDPMADVARVLSSIRDWGRNMDIPDAVLREVEKKFFEGYRQTRTEKENNRKSEFDQTKILVYEARLDLIKLKKFDSLREKIKAALSGAQTEAEFYDSVTNGEIENLKAYGLGEREIKDMEELVSIRKNVMEIIQYLRQIEIKK